MITNYEKNNFKLHQPLFRLSVYDYREMLLRDPYTILFYEFTTPGHDNGPAGYDELSCIPSGCLDVLFITNSRKTSMEFVGTTTGLHHLKTFPGSKYFGVRLIPGMFLSYNGLSLKEAANEEIFFNGENGILKEFFNNLKKTSALEEKIELFYHFFHENLDNSKVNELTQFLISEINSSCGNIRISKLAEDIHYSERHISRIFQDSMGITPKTFTRIIRFQYAVDSILNSKALSVGDFFYELGYSDQAHFQREFKQYTGTTPRNFYIYAKGIKGCF